VTLPLIGLAVLALVILAFVLEPVLRARPDRVELDAAALTPLPERRTGDDELLVNEDELRERDGVASDEVGTRPSGAPVDRRAVGDLS
jgi:hypothetical protein